MDGADFVSMVRGDIGGHGIGEKSNTKSKQSDYKCEKRFAQKYSNISSPFLTYHKSLACGRVKDAVASIGYFLAKI